jgi:Tol biopolymer transport system component
VSVIAALSVASGSARAAFPGANGRIAYGVWASPTRVKHEIFTIRPTGTGNRLLPLPGDFAHPAWSPDGRMLAFNRVYNGGIWTARADGSSASEVIPVREPWLWAEHPAWAPDGQRLAFNARWEEPRPGAGENDIGHTTIYVAGPDRIPRRLREGSEPEWLRDGTRIAYVGPGDRSIRIVRADGSDPETLVRNVNFPHNLDLSPDGRMLLFNDLRRQPTVRHGVRRTPR